MSNDLTGPPETQSPKDLGSAAAMSVTVATENPDEATPAGAVERVRKRSVAAILLLGFGQSLAVLAPPSVFVPYFVGVISPDQKATVLGFALGVGSLVVMLFVPFFGALSDRTTSRLGMRRPGMILGTVVFLISLVIQGLAPSAAVMILGAVVGGIGAAIWGASFQALIPDAIPHRLRGRVLGLQSLLLVIAAVTISFVGPLLLGNQLIAFTAFGVIYIITTVIGLLLFRDRTLDRQYLTRLPLWHTVIDGYRINPRKEPDFSWVWASRFLVTFAIAWATSFVLYVLTDQIGIGQDELGSAITFNGLATLGGTVTGTLVGAFLADKVRDQKRLVLMSASIITVGGVVVALSHSLPVFLVGVVITALGIGTFLPTDGALVMRVLPGNATQNSKYMALITIADQLPRAIAPIVAPAIIGLGALTVIGGYAWLYFGAGLFAIAGGLVVLRLRSAK